MTLNPYLLAGFASNNAAQGGFIPPPGAVFGQADGFQPAPGSYFGRGGACPPQPQPCDPCAPSVAGQHQLAEVLNYMRGFPRNQWPRMPPLSECGEQEVAARVVAEQQIQADGLGLYYGVDSGVVVPAGATALIVVSPQMRHVPERLSLTEAMAAAFLITEIQAGVVNVLATSGAISASIFIQNSTAKPFKSIIVNPGLDITVGVTNITGADQRFIATMVGKPVPPGM